MSSMASSPTGCSYEVRTSPSFPFALAEPGEFQQLSVRRNQRVNVLVRVSPTSPPVMVVALVTENETHYEIGPIMKKSIYGYVIVSVRLEPTEEFYDNPQLGHSRVYKRGKLVAIKVYLRTKLRELSGRNQEKPLMELTALQYIGDRHPNVLGQLECLSDADSIYSIMRHCSGGELFDIVEQHGPMSPSRARKMFHQVCSGLLFLHTLGVAHRDMSLENVLYDEANDQYVIIDLGMCVRQRRNPHYRPSAETTAEALNLIFHGNKEAIEAFGNCFSETLPVDWHYLLPAPHRPHNLESSPYCATQKGVACGKKYYISPEMYSSSKTAPVNLMLCDLWALGIMLFMALTGVPPMDSALPCDPRFLKVCDNQLSQLVSAWRLNIDSSAMDLIQRLLQRDPLERLTLPEIFDHPWMRQQ